MIDYISSPKSWEKMGKLTEIAEYSIRYDRKLKEICTHLGQLGFSYFGYYSIDECGNFVMLSNYPEQLSFYYRNEFYLEEPYLTFPGNFRSGCVMVPSTLNPESQKISIKEFHYDHLFLKLHCKDQSIEGYIFADEYLNPSNGAKFFPKLDLLDRFAFFFKQEARGIIQKIRSEGYNLKREKNEAFYSDVSKLPLAKKNPFEEAFLNKISPLSPRERECVELFKQGYTAHATASILGISQRTVEFYFDNIKGKLNCSSKWQLLDY